MEDKQCKTAYRKMIYHNRTGMESYRKMLKHGRLAKDAESNTAAGISNMAKGIYYIGNSTYHSIMNFHYSLEVDIVCPQWVSHPDWRNRSAVIKEMTSDD